MAGRFVFREGGIALFEKRNPGNGQDAGRSWFALIGLSLVLVVSVFAAFSCGAGQTARSGGQDQPEGSDGGNEQASRESSGEKLGHPALGSDDAPVTMIEYSDYQ